MYSEWASLQEEIQQGKGNKSVLHKFPPIVGKDVACVVVRYIAANLSIAVTTDEPSNLETDKDVKWTMEVLCYGLGLPLTEHDTINDCVKVYCEWLTALIIPKSCVPEPVMHDPNPYAQDIMNHLLNLFKPRPNTGVDLVKRQALLCHRVLRTIELVAKESYIMSRGTWESLLKFLLTATDSLLSPPTEKDDIGDHLCERMLSVLFGIWMISCSKCFPSPSLWKTFSNMSLFWRHHEALVLQWHKINHALTSQLIRIMYGSDYPELTVSEDDASLIPPNTSNECITQSWFRFLHLIQNPVDLSKPMIIGGTQRFLQYALSSHDVVEPSQHECLMKLPIIFAKAMRGTSIMINAFLGIPQSVKDDDLMWAQASAGKTAAASPATPPGQRRMVKPMQVLAVTLSQRGSSKIQIAQKSSAPIPVIAQFRHYVDHNYPFAPNRPRCNSILHLFGAWLFDASLVGVKLHQTHAAPAKPNRTSSFIESITPEQLPTSEVNGDNTYEAGRAEACGILCRIFSAHKTGEEILPVYYSRFYLCMYYGLQTDEQMISGHVLSNILFNSCNLLRVDLAGVQILVPYFLNALELVLSKTAPDFKLCDQIPYVELRKACVHLLLSMLCLPLHFKDLQIKDILNTPDSPESGLTFISLKGRIIDLLQKALSNETDCANTNMLLGGLMLLVQDLATSEELDKNTDQLEPDIRPTETNTDIPFSPTLTTDAGVSRNSTTTPIDTNHLDISYSKPHPHQSNKQIENAYGLFGHATSLVCNRLMASWKSELNTALAAMELLAGLAKVSVSPPNMLMCKRTVKWICDFIVYQCSRPAPSHSRDLHSMIVAAFKCLLLWLVEHSTLLYDKECLHNVLEVVELGISGSKSQGKVQETQTVKTKVDEKSKNVTPKNRASDPPKFKGDKELMPASMRVKDAAEAVLTCIIDQVGAFPPPCGPESVYSLLDEKTLLHYANTHQGSQFRYYVIDNSIIVALLEQPLGQVQDTLPTVTALIRGPFGRHAWTMQLRHSPRVQKIPTKTLLVDPGRPIPDNNVGIHHNVEHRYFPESIDKIPLTKTDKSIPQMESLITDDNRDQLEKLKGYIEKSLTFENEVSEQVRKEREATAFPNPQTECKAPKICQGHQTARLFLSHYGFLTLECLKEPSNSSCPPALVMLDTSNSAIFADIEALDSVPSRDNDTLHIFYVKSGQKTLQEILANVADHTTVQSQFLEFLYSLGWPVDVKKHAGWTGHISTSWKTLEPECIDDDEYQSGSGGSIYDGRQQVLYWADVSSEIAFVVPSTETNKLIPAVVEPDVPPHHARSHSIDVPPHYGRSNSIDVPPHYGRSNSIDVPPHYGRSHSIDVPPHYGRSHSIDVPPHYGRSHSSDVSPHARSHSIDLGRFDFIDKSPLLKQHQEKSSIPESPVTKPKTLLLESEKAGVTLRDSPVSPVDLNTPYASMSTMSTASITSRSRRLGRQPAMTGPDIKVFAVWLENFDDQDNIPIADLISVSSTGQEHLNSSSTQKSQAENEVFIIFIHALQNGLFRIHLQGNEKAQTKLSMAIPLVDGMLVSRRTLGTMIRQTVINISRRKRMESETYQPPHVRRKFKIQEIVNKYRLTMTEAEFYTSLFQEVPK